MSYRPDDPQLEPLTEYDPHSLTGESVGREPIIDDPYDDYWAEDRYTRGLMGSE